MNRTVEDILKFLARQRMRVTGAAVRNMIRKKLIPGKDYRQITGRQQYFLTDTAFDKIITHYKFKFRNN